MKKGKNKNTKSDPFAVFTQEITRAYRDRRYDAADAILETHRREMTAEQENRATQMARFVRDFDPDPMYGRMSRPETAGLFLAYGELRKTGSGRANVLVDFLEASPTFHGSGYIKEAVLHILKRSPTNLEPELAGRLRSLILAAVQDTPKRHRRYFWRLAPRVANSMFVGEIAELTSHEVAYVRDNASAVAQILKSNEAWLPDLPAPKA